MEQSTRFFAKSQTVKLKCVNDQSFAGYTASGEEVTAGAADSTEVFTVLKDLPQTDARVKHDWPCHGPCPWPSLDFKAAMMNLMSLTAGYGEKVLKLTGLGLGLSDENALKDLTNDGWHHLRLLRYVLNSTYTVADEH